MASTHPPKGVAWLIAARGGLTTASSGSSANAPAAASIGSGVDEARSPGGAA
jgi:hypothetical protein